jgi:hypothetical protein
MCNLSKDIAEEARAEAWIEVKVLALGALHNLS